MEPFTGLLSLVGKEWLCSYSEKAAAIDQISPVKALECALQCANEAGQMVRDSLAARTSGHVSSLSTKSSVADLVTETDIAVEKAIRSRISGTFPTHLFVGEEGTSEPVSVAERAGNFVWIIDPIDGTTNFVHSFPVVTVSIALAYQDESIMGVVYNPMTDELWFAWKGCGSVMKRSSGEMIKIRTSGCEELGSALVSTGFAVPLLRRKTVAVKEQESVRSIVEGNMRVLMTQSRDLRRIGSAACDICYVAMGRTDSYFEFGIREWDIAAGLVILHEAGGDSSTVGGVKPYSIRGRNLLVASSEKLRKQLNGVLTDTNIVPLIEAVER